MGETLVDAASKPTIFRPNLVVLYVTISTYIALALGALAVVFVFSSGVSQFLYNLDPPPLGLWMVGCAVIFSALISFPTMISNYSVFFVALSSGELTYRAGCFRFSVLANAIDNVNIVQSFKYSYIVIKAGNQYFVLTSLLWSQRDFNRLASAVSHWIERCGNGLVYESRDSMAALEKTKPEIVKSIKHNAWKNMIKFAVGWLTVFAASSALCVVCRVSLFH